MEELFEAWHSARLLFGMTVGKLNSLWLSDVRFGSLACPQAMGMGVMAPRYASVEGAGDDAGEAKYRAYRALFLLLAREAMRSGMRP